MALESLPFTDWTLFTRLGEIPEPVVSALIGSVATTALLVGLAPRLVGRRTPAREKDTSGTACEFLINGANVRALTEPARALLETLPKGPSKLSSLSEHLSAENSQARTDIEALVLYGQPFRRHLTRTGGAQQEIFGEPRGGAAYLCIRAASEDARALQNARRDLDRADEELRFLREMLDRAPLAAWRTAPDGQVDWANAGYRERFDASDKDVPDHRIANAFDHVIEEVPLTAPEGCMRRRVALPGSGTSEPKWFEVRQVATKSGESLGFAAPADELVAAEASLRRFVETLTETFAHLPIGLAVFDKNRRLGLFNPALTDLVKIDAVWLAGRPSLRDFLERLRETRQMPEQKDFASWRRKLTELEEGAREGTYEQNWELPSGKIFRVTGRPHPQGALAFLFEDISTAIMLERKYRSELVLSQATLDRMGDAVAVFDASGMLVFVNAAFENLWSLDPMQKLDGPNVGEITELCAARCAPSPAWSKLSEFAMAADERTSWNEEVSTLDGRTLQLLVAPLPDASALVVFRDLTTAESEMMASLRQRGLAPTREQDLVLEELALDRIHAPVESAIRELMSAIPAARSNEAFQTLSATARTLKDGLARSRELRVVAYTDEEPGHDAFSGLAALARERGLTLDAPAEAKDWPAPTRRVAIATTLAAADACKPRATLVLTAETEGDATVVVVCAPAETAPKDDGVNLALARKLAENADGALAVEHAEGELKFTARITASGEGASATSIALRA